MYVKDNVGLKLLTFETPVLTLLEWDSNKTIKKSPKTVLCKLTLRQPLRNTFARLNILAKMFFFKTMVKLPLVVTAL